MRSSRLPPVEQPFPFLPLSSTALVFVPLPPSFDQTDADSKGKHPERDEQGVHRSPGPERAVTLPVADGCVGVDQDQSANEQGNKRRGGASGAAWVASPQRG